MDKIELTEIEKAIIGEALVPMKAARGRAIMLINHILKDRGADEKDSYNLNEEDMSLVLMPRQEVPPIGG